MRLLFTFLRAYPGDSAFMLLALLLAGLLEGVGISMLLPLISVALRGQNVIPAAAAGQMPAERSQLEQTIVETLAAVGLTPSVGLLLTAIVAAIGLKSAMILVANKRIGYTVARVATDLRLALLRALLLTRWDFHLRQPVGALANAMATEAQRSSKAYLRGVTVTALAIQGLVYAGVAFLVSWQATVLSIGAGILMVIVLRRFVRKARRAGDRQTRLLKSLIGLMTDTLQSIKPLKAMAREDRVDFLLVRTNRRLKKALKKQVFSKEMMRAFQEPILVSFLAVGLYVALVLWHLSLATVMVMAFLTARLIKQLNKIQDHYQEMVTMQSAYFSMQATISEAQNAQEAVWGHSQPTLNRGIFLDRVTFAYGDNPVLDHATASVGAGLITAIVGPSGSGKTTVVDLITGLLKPDRGVIRIDDVPLTELDLRRWRQMIGYVPQESLLLHDTVLANVTLGDPQLSEADAQWALRAAGAWEFVQDLPMGMQAVVGERGGKLSGGQRQRIAIARALVQRPKLLILDEATSALDQQSEEAVCRTLQQLRGELTILAISHQPAVVAAADQAFRIHQGVIVVEKPLENPPDGRTTDMICSGN